MASRKPRSQKPAEDDELEGEVVGEPEEEEEETEGEDAEGEDAEVEDDDTDQLLADEDAAADAEALPFYQDVSGYNLNYDWASVPEAERRTHEEILRMDLEQLDKLKLPRLGLLDRWAASQAYRRAGRIDIFQESCRSILKSRSHHDGLSYEDIYLELISTLADQGERDESFTLLEKFTKTFPELADVAKRARALLLLSVGQTDEGRVVLNELITAAERADRADACLEIGESLSSIHQFDIALDVFRRGKNIARRIRDADLISAIDDSVRNTDERIEQRQQQAR